MTTSKRIVGFGRVSSILAGAALVAIAPSTAFAMDPFVDSSQLLGNDDAHSGAPMAVADMNGDGLDDIVRLDSDNNGFLRFLEFEYQQPDGSFMLGERTDLQLDSWSIAVADVDGNGYNDIFTGGAFDDKLLLLANDDGTGYTQTSLPGPGIFVQCSSFADINNDGNLDFFVCADTSKSLVYHGDGTGTMAFTYDNLDPESTVQSDNSGNYGNVWSDFDLDGDVDLYVSKCRQGISDPMDGRRLNQLFRNNGDGTFTDVADEVGLRPGGQTWVNDFADIDNDGDLDAFVLNHEDFATDAPSELYINDGEGNFTAITEAAGIRDALDGLGRGIQNHFADFDNDGYVDLLLSTSGGNSSRHQILFNNADGTFTADNSVLPGGNLRMQSFAVGDLNNDGRLDILGGFGVGFNSPTSNPDLLLLNPATDGNNWLKVHLRGVESNRDGVGAVIQITGSWGTQTREIRSGESYGISHSLTEHFGLGPDETVESITVTWPSGTVDELEDITANQRIEINEGCQLEFFTDADEDGFGDPDTGVAACIKPSEGVADNTDCDDDDPDNYPGNIEVCDGADNNCDGEADEGLEDCNAESETDGDETDGDETEGSETDGEPGTTSTGPVDPTGTPGSDSDSETEGDTDDSAGQSGDGGGCAVSTPGTDAGLFLFLLGIGAPLLRRRLR